MLYNSKEITETKENHPKVNNNLKPVQSSKGEKFLYYFIIVFASLTIIGIPFVILWVIRIKNELQSMQLKINESASGIHIQLQKRFDTLTKLVDTVKGQVEFEKSTLETITSLRSGISNLGINEANQKIDEIHKNINLAFESYPNLGTNISFQKLMNEVSIIEREISATRRLYNSNVTLFNQRIYTFPANIFASKRQYIGVELFQASEISQQDVKINFN